MGAPIPFELIDVTRDPDVTHALASERDVDADWWLMRCGERVRVFGDGTCVPPLNFYSHECAHKATCEGCRPS